MTTSTTMYGRAEAILPQLVEDFEGGKTISAMAEEYGIRREAVATVLTANGYGVSSSAREAILAYVRNNPGLSVDDLAIRLDMTKSSISRYLRGSKERHLVVTRKGKDLNMFSDAEMAESLRAVFRALSPEQRSDGLSRVRYNKLRAEGTPAASTYIRRYGSWSGACELAGINASKPRREGYRHEFSDEDILVAIEDFTADTGLITYNAYVDWARENGRPSGPLVIQRLGGWAVARREVLRRQGERAA
jgi:DNA-binding transcriptional ArsR family regulator